ncbi:MAG: arsenate reductase [Flavobacteriales bacterium]|nr:arsenate reductase [Flavobacteriales bacterium]MBK9539351.1 arsenate reductase [Flavobacteriales bacterium]
MPRIIYYLGTCSTCERILKEIPNLKSFTMREIKGDPITSAELDAMKKLAGSYEALFSRIALKYRALGLKEKTLTEKDYRKYILQEYTFLKRPVMILDNEIFIGNAPKVTAAMVQAASKIGAR